MLPVVWWHNHEIQFPNICFLAKQILGIVRSQIEVECVFSFANVWWNLANLYKRKHPIKGGKKKHGASVLIALRHCKLQVENLDHIITIVKNWFNDPCLNHTHHMDLIDFMEVENLLAKENYDLVEELNCFEWLELKID